MTHNDKKLSVFQGSLLVLGTSVGGGMLGLPIMTAQGGFYPSCFMMVLSWFFMTLTGLIMAELTCRIKQNANLLTLYSARFPKFGAIASITIYFVLFYSLMVAYILALGRMVFEGLSSFNGALSLSQTVVTALVALFFGLVVWGMRSFLSAVNTFLVGVMALAYVGFIGFGSEIVQADRLQRVDWTQALTSLPLIFTSFGFQGTVPSLSSLMGYDRKSIVKAILYGTLATLFIYVLWQMIVLSAIPFEGHMGLEYAMTMGFDAVTPLQYHLTSTVSSSLLLYGKLFALSAVATSLIGVSIGVNDFIADIFKVHHKTPRIRFLLCAISFGPALVCALIYPSAFLHALSVAGGIGCAFLLGLMPSLTAQGSESYMSSESEIISWEKKLMKIVLNPYVLYSSIAFFAVEIGYEISLLIKSN